MGKPFDPPENLDDVIWRYMSFAKFVAMLDSGALYFARAVDLEKDDPFEGRVPRAGMTLNGEPLQMGDAFDRIRHLIRVRARLNCWHRSPHESVAMWQIYGKLEGALAIRSTYRALTEALGDQATVGIVQYIDYEVDTIEIGGVAAPLFYKRREFEYEQEVRALEAQRERAIPAIGKIIAAMREKKVAELEADFCVDAGCNIEVDLQNLVHEVVIAPGAGGWVKQLVDRVVSKYGLPELQVRASAIDLTPTDG